MPTVTGLTAARMKVIEDQSIVDGSVVGDNLVLTRFDGGTINAGNVRGPQGIQGPPGDVAEAPEDGAPYVRRNGVWVAGVREANEDGQIYARLDGSWASIQSLLDRAKYAAKGLLDEQTTPDNESLDTIGELKRNTGAQISVTNNDDHVRQYQCFGWTRLESDNSGLYRVYITEASGSALSLSREAQVRVVGAGAAYAVDGHTVGAFNLAPGASKTICVSAMKVTGSNGDMTNARISLYDVGGVPA